MCKCQMLPHFQTAVIQFISQSAIRRLHIYLPDTDDFMTSVSAHGGLVHVVLRVRKIPGQA